MIHKIKLILKSVRQYKTYALITPIFMVVEAALECMMPFIMSVLIDDIGLINQTSDIVYKQFDTTLCDPMNRSTPGLPVHHQFPEFTQTHVH